jgi:hypothetical protein
MKRSVVFLWGAVLVVVAGLVYAAVEVPLVIQQPGTQPQEVSNLESPDKCDNCHGGYNSLVEPAHNWRGTMMANAGRDPIFWATLAVAEQDFYGAGDLCIRCHSTAGWLAGRSTPTDGSGLTAGDSDGVECDFCHKLTNPDDSEYRGEQFDPFLANQDGVGYYGTGMASVWGGSEKLGPYTDTSARHKFLPSNFHRSVEFCGTCHDVSNSAVGNLAHNRGTQGTGSEVIADDAADGPVDTKAAFNNLPFMYGVVERTFSEHMASAWPTMRVEDYGWLPLELQAGAAKAAYESALVAGNGGDFEDGETRYFTCQTCHMRPVEGKGCNKKGALNRKDLALHDMTGGNYWMPEAIKYQDTQGQLRLGGGLTATQIAALDDGAVRAMKQLSQAASLIVDGDTVRIVNHTGHKLISGYPEGRRMWLNIRWYDGSNPEPMREDGAYGPISPTFPDPNGGPQIQVESIFDLHDPNTRIYEAHYGLTQEWADQLVALNPASAPVPLEYNRLSGAPGMTIGELADEASGTVHESFHFVLNNTVIKDNRIPPYGFSYDDAMGRNALPVPADQYGGAPGGTYSHVDALSLNVPESEAAYAEIDLLYQPTSWEYIQFLYLAVNQEGNPFLADEGANMLEAWLATGMAEPYVMASATWNSGAVPPTPAPTPIPSGTPVVTPTPTPTPTATPAPAGPVWTESLVTYRAGKRGQVVQTNTFKAQDNVLIEARVTDGNTGLSGAQVFIQITSPGTDPVAIQGFSDANGLAELQWRIPRKQAPGVYTAMVTDIIKNSFSYDPGSGVNSVQLTIQ